MEGSCCAAKAAKAQPQKTPAEYIALYRPVIVITAVSAAVALALAAGGQVPFMRGMMGAFLCLLAVLKLFDLQGFAAGFARYDVLAKRFPAYGRAYPFVELGLAFLYLSGFHLMAANVVMVAVMAVGSLGVANVICTGQKVQCACVGSGFNLPVGRVTLAENLVMGAMAAAMIAMALMHGGM